VEPELGLEVGLVETGIHALGVVDLELAEEVDLAVGRVDGPVQSLARGRVREIGVDDQHVVGGQSGQGHAPFRRPPGMSTSSPLSVAEWTAAAASSMNVDRLGPVHAKEMVEMERKVLSLLVRSRVTS
jgi:hypothetical protein